MKFCGFSLAFIAAAAAAPSVGASVSSSSLRGGNDNGRDTPHRLLPGQGKAPELPPGAPSLPPAAQANAKAEGKAKGGPFGGSGTTTTTSTTTTTTTTTAAGCDGGWKLNEPYCYFYTVRSILRCITFTTCPTSDAVGTTIGEYKYTIPDSGTYSEPVDLNSFTSDTVISTFICPCTETITLSADGNSFEYGDGDIYTIEA
jgi:hypothetical protein